MFELNIDLKLHRHDGSQNNTERETKQLKARLKQQKTRKQHKTNQPYYFYLFCRYNTMYNQQNKKQ